MLNKVNQNSGRLANIAVVFVGSVFLIAAAGKAWGFPAFYEEFVRYGLVERGGLALFLCFGFPGKIRGLKGGFSEA